MELSRERPNLLGGDCFRVTLVGIRHVSPPMPMSHARLALFLRNDFPFFEASFASALLGGYAVPVNWHLTGDEAGYINGQNILLDGGTFPGTM